MRMVVVDADRVVQELRTGVPAQRPAGTDRGVVAEAEFPIIVNAEMVREVLEGFDGGRVVIALTAHPGENPPEPEAVALLVHQVLVERGVREDAQIALVTPAAPAVPAGDAPPSLLADSGIEWYPGHLVRSIDPARRVARFEDGSAMPFDLFLGIPHRHDDES